MFCGIALGCLTAKQYCSGCLTGYRSIPWGRFIEVRKYRFCNHAIGCEGLEVTPIVNYLEWFVSVLFRISRILVGSLIPPLGNREPIKTMTNLWPSKGLGLTLNSLQKWPVLYPKQPGSNRWPASHSGIRWIEAIADAQQAKAPNHLVGSSFSHPFDTPISFFALVLREHAPSATPTTNLSHQIMSRMIEIERLEIG